MAGAMGTIRLATAADGEAIAGIYAPHVVDSATSFEIDPPAPAEMAQRVTDTLVSYPWLVFVEHGIVGGYAYGSRHRPRAAYQWSVEVSAYVGESFRRRGVAQGLYASLFRILVAQGYVSAYAGITLPNPASVALHESVGFAPVGVYSKIGFKCGGWRDVGWWQMPLQPYPVAPPAPQPHATIVARDDFDALLASGITRVRGVEQV